MLRDHAREEVPLRTAAENGGEGVTADLDGCAGMRDTQRQHPGGVLTQTLVELNNETVTSHGTSS